jgi:hypothetical protein
LLWGGILLLATNEAPDFVTLQPPHAKVANVLVVEGRADGSEVGQQLDHGVFGDTRHPHGGANRAAFNQTCNNACAGLGVKAVHGLNYIAKAALACQWGMDALSCRKLRGLVIR